MSSPLSAGRRRAKAALRRVSLAHQLVLITVLLAVLTAGTTAGVSIGFIRQHVLDDISEKEQFIIDIQAQRLALRLNAAVHNLLMMSSSSLARTAIVDNTGRDAYFLPLLEGYRISEDIKVEVGLYDFEGELLIAAQPGMPPSFRGEPWIDRVMHSRLQAGIHEQPEQLRLVIALPVYSPYTQMPEGMLVGLVSPKELLAGLKPTGTAHGFSLLSANEIVATAGYLPSPSESFVVEHALRLAAPLDQLWMTLQMRQERSIAFAPLSGYMLLIVSFGLGIVALNALAALLLGRRLTQPLVRFAAAARSVVETGNLRQLLPSGHPGEIGVLSDAFRAMLLHLDDLHETLEQRVAQRTCELHLAQQEIAASAAHLSAILNNATHAIVTVDEGGCVDSVNPALEQMLGFSRQEVVGQPISRIIAGELRRLASHTRNEDVGSPGRAIYEFEGRCKDGSTLSMEMARSEVTIAGRRLCILVICDISERKRIARLKDEFVSTVSHELRTPLTSIRGSLGLLASGRIGALPAAMTRLVAIALGNSERLVLLVNDILDMQKIESGNMEFECSDVDLARLMAQGAEANEAYARTHGVTYRINPGPDCGLIHADAMRVAQVINNLLSNAAKFSPKDAVIELALTRNDGMLRVAVSDRGAGVPPEFRPKLFARFAQADGSDRRANGGTGLGLAISRAMVERQGGRIGYEDRPGGGSVFFFEFAEVTEQAGAPQPRPPQHVAGLPAPVA